MGDQRVRTLWQPLKRLAVAGHHQLGFQAADQAQRVEVVGQWIARGAHVQAD